ncbi:MAG: hypothetical protein M3Z04_05355 [Chloroflexota bacterium]|nr:hypothetical protein [Chloroflexota bacterium]
MSAHTIAWLMRACTFGIGAGILAMIQPFVFEGFRYGFLLLLLATIGFTIVSHLRPRPSAVTEAAGPPPTASVLIAPDSPPAAGGGSL